MPFVYQDGILSLTDFHTSGPSLGLTAAGKLFLRETRLDVDGTIVPIYLVNSLVGNLPLLGDLITGEKGGGLFAATYTMTGSFSNPEMTVNPLAVILPGFLRNLFKIFKAGQQTQDNATEQGTAVGQGKIEHPPKEEQ
ncbi:MAG: hypothetical protein FD153_1371 [Rhodospirillaceae bacterium]|nr:MAG: hypothetical protein FD153_1371 [Rhodospirillaceae bacterium]